MKRLLLIDDEEIARQHIKEAFPWEEWGYTIVGEATNGIEALTAIEALNPDVALIDITMPVMDGLTLLKHINNRFSQTKCVILTAHREFSYINQAMQHGALGYILKSPINLIETKEALDKASKESEKDMTIMSASINHKTIQSNSYPLRKHYFQQILMGLYAEDGEINQKGKEIGANLSFDTTVLVVVEVDGLVSLKERYSSNDRMLIEFSMLEMIRESLQESFPIHSELFPLEFGKVVVLLASDDKSLDKEGSMAACLRLEQTIQGPLEKYLDVSIKLAASEPFSRLNQLRSIYKQINGLFIYRFYQEKPKTIFTYGLRPFGLLSMQHVSELNALADNLQVDRSHAAYVRILHKIKAYLLEWYPSPAEVLNWFQSLASRMTDAAYLPEWPQFEVAINLSEAIQFVLAWLQKCDRIVAEAIVVRPEIARAILYIRQHLGGELTVDAIAGESGLSTSHFSHIFKKETGMSVIDYVLEQRIELAKQYLAEGKFRNYELSEKVGFQHYSYFSNIFKKMTGMSPNEYKRTVKNVITSPN
ncbi:response regulator [Paenibacillus qinlingensis]|uniref:Two-component system response regulator YesN n=1 Tax=Paenibacillus qinlingensis TaxID=1837343 RepID=A0ABU1P3K5_9BACL|nr:response regulator [Paenibacillus qinlingensis]MDR6553941.1 two-component system response regulator YesN [Paenibacillus qinlingensis]